MKEGEVQSKDGPCANAKIRVSRASQFVKCIQRRGRN